MFLSHLNPSACAESGGNLSQLQTLARPRRKVIQRKFNYHCYASLRQDDTQKSATVARAPIVAGLSTTGHRYMEEMLLQEHTGGGERIMDRARPLLQLMHSTMNALRHPERSKQTSCSTSDSQPAVIVLRAPSGSTRSLSYLLPLMDQAFIAASSSSGGRRVSVVIVASTTELAARIHREAFRISGSYGGLHVQLIHGQVSLRHDLSELRSRCPDVLVTTPGRLFDIMTEHRAAVQHLFWPGIGKAQKGYQAGSGSSLGIAAMVIEGAENVLNAPMTRSFVATIRRLLAPKQLLLTCELFSGQVEMEARALGLQAQSQASSSRNLSPDRDARHATDLGQVAQSKPVKEQKHLPMLLLQAPAGMPASIQEILNEGFQCDPEQNLFPMQLQQQQGESLVRLHDDSLVQATPLQVLSVPAGELVSQLLGLLYHYGRQHQHQSCFRAIVLCPTAATAKLYRLLYKSLGIPSVDLNSRQNRPYRLEALELFKQGERHAFNNPNQAPESVRGHGGSMKSIVLLATETLLHGADLSGVNLVVQVGCSLNVSNLACTWGLVDSLVRPSAHQILKPAFVSLVMHEEQAYLQHLCRLMGRSKLLGTLRPPASEVTEELNDRVHRIAISLGQNVLTNAYLSMLSWYCRHPAMCLSFPRLDNLSATASLRSKGSIQRLGISMVNAWASPLTEGHVIPEVPQDIALRMGLNKSHGICIEIGKDHKGSAPKELEKNGSRYRRSSGALQDTSKGKRAIKSANKHNPHRTKPKPI